MRLLSVWWLAGVVGVVVLYLAASIILVPYFTKDAPLPLSPADIKGFSHLFQTHVFKTTTQTDDCSAGGASWGDLNGGLFPAMLGINCNHSTPLYIQNSRYIQETTFNGTTYGSCWGDMNKDGWDDVVLVGEGPDQIYYNMNGTFKLDPGLYSLSRLYGDGLSCILIDLNSDGYLDVVRVSISHNVSVFKYSSKGFLDMTNDTGLRTTVKSFVAIGNLPKPHLALISSEGYLEIYDIRHLPYRNVTAKFSGIPRHTLANARIYDMDNDRNYDLVLLPTHSPPVVAYNFGNLGFYAYTLPGPLENLSSAEDVPLGFTIGDFNNDMLPDIYVARRTTFNITNIIYLNQGDSFVAVEGSMAALGVGPVSLNAIDFNVDGHVDLSVFSTSGIHLFLNNKIVPNNWIEIELVPEGQHSVSGTMVRLKANNVSQQQVFLGAERTHKRLHFGLGNATVVDEIEIFWFFFAGVSYKFYGIAVNQLVTLTLPLAMFEPPAKGFEVINARPPMHIRCPEGHSRLKPGFLILGIWKAGTTSLASTLAQHPQVVEASRKEIFYFSKYSQRLPPDWYWSQFPCTDSSRFLISFEATAGYIYSHDAPPMIKEHIPNAKFIVMLREPVERMYSHFYMNTRDGFEGAKKFDEIVRLRLKEFQHCPVVQNNCSSNPDSSECMASLDNGCAGNLLSAGLYYFEIKRWFAYFPPEQFKFIHYRDFVSISNATSVVDDVQRFLGIEVVSLDMMAKNISPKREPMWNSTRQILKEFFQPYNKLVYQLLRFDFDWDKT